MWSQALGFFKGSFYVYTFIKTATKGKHSYSATLSTWFLASPVGHQSVNRECFFILCTRYNLVSLCVLLPGWVTASLMSCGSKAGDTEQGGSESLELWPCFPMFFILIGSHLHSDTQGALLHSTSILQVYKITSTCEVNLLFPQLWIFPLTLLWRWAQK